MKIKNFKTFSIILLFLFALNGAASAQADIARETLAITYPQNETATVQFRGTTRFPRMKGEAKIKRTVKNGTEIDLSISKMPRPFELGAGYATYVLWALSPEGQIENLGEIKRRGFFEFDSKISVTTKLQTFALIVTAEPHFLVRRPSRAIMLENLNAVMKNGIIAGSTKTISYFGNSSDYFSDARTPEIAETDYAKTPSTILQAKQAIALAKFAGAQRDANEELKKAEDLLKKAESEWQAGRAETDVDVSARQAVSAGVLAEETARTRKSAREQRNARQQQDAEIQKAEDKYLDAMQQIENLKFELARETRNRELTERDAQNFNDQIKQLREENTNLKIENEKLRNEASEAKLALAKIEGEKEAAEKQRKEQENINNLRANMPILMQTLKSVGTVSRNNRGISLIIPEAWWTSARTESLAPVAESGIVNLASILSSNPDYKILIESHTDNRGAADELVTLTQNRANLIAAKLSETGISNERIEAKGYGAGMPIASNNTNASRAKNRRIQITLIPTFQ